MGMGVVTGVVGGVPEGGGVYTRVYEFLTILITRRRSTPRVMPGPPFPTLCFLFSVFGFPLLASDPWATHSPCNQSGMA